MSGEAEGEGVLAVPEAAAEVVEVDVPEGAVVDVDPVAEAVTKGTLSLVTQKPPVPTDVPTPGHVGVPASDPAAFLQLCCPDEFVVKVEPVGHVGLTFVVVILSHVVAFSSWYPAGQDILAYSLRR